MSYSDLLDLDTRPVPEMLREESMRAMGAEPLSTERYISPEFARLENEKMWPNVWQFAAREEDFPEPGDTVIYDNAGRTFVLVRQPDGAVRAFYNVCLHRGRKLRTMPGRASELRCPYHGFTWNTDGTLKEIPCAWDFKHLNNDEMSLPEVRVDRWQGFVMISEKQDIEPFADWVGPAAAHYDRWRLDDCYTAAWIGRVIPANWKATAEAFMEAWHAITTHPQILPFTGDANTRYDLYGDHMSRAITPSAVLSPHIAHLHDQEFILQKLQSFLAAPSEEGAQTSRRSVVRFSDAAEADGESGAGDPVMARKMCAEANRKVFGEMSGRDYSDVSDSEMTDNFTYNIFPNFAPWGGFIPNIIYRWRPVRDPDHCLMEVRVLARAKEGEPKPKTGPMHLIPEDQPFMSAAHIIGPGLAGVFDQDMGNLPHVQEGMKASFNKQLQLGNYQESRIRHFHETLDKYLSA
ncbi:MAG: aromatic ring-hydroxylating dioxygenase subunit alpha [Caulobacterales bacterium]|nr:aromatic ring-hydroxylating dioxygenase subunit alpha [Caulobacterales bacterium]